MIKPIYSSEEHKAIIESYILMCQEFAKDVSTKSRYNSYLEVLDTILDYHNSYGEGTRENNFYDWLVIIPINLSVATNGFLAGIETNNNRSVVRAYKTVLDEMVGEVVDKIDKLEQTDE
jgi:hypothetical protein|tara:strand:- start:813 stop:1169 length:357 start_codon:yes stop_codon:yes gene_type:complete